MRNYTLFDIDSMRESIKEHREKEHGPFWIKTLEYNDHEAKVQREMELQTIVQAGIDPDQVYNRTERTREKFNDELDKFAKNRVVGRR